MDERMLAKAEKLAKQPYQVQVFQDFTTEGKLVHVALVPELPGCVTHGNSAPEAKARLEMVKTDFIYFLLEDDLEVPEPARIATNESLQVGSTVGAGEDSAPLTFGVKTVRQRIIPKSSYRFAYEVS